MVGVGKKILSGVLLTTSVAGSVIGASSVQASTNIDGLWVKAYKATETAKKEGTQDTVNIARKAIRELKDAVKGDKELHDNLIGTLSGMLDPVQNNLFIEFYKVIYEDDKITEKKNLTQEEINKGRDYILQFKGAVENETYIPSWSSALDKFQQDNINNVEATIKKVESLYLESDLKEAEMLADDLMKVTNNEDVKMLSKDLKIKILGLKVNFVKVNDFRDTYKDVIGLTEDTVIIYDESSVLGAINAYEKLLPEIKSILLKERNHFDKLSKKIDKLKENIQQSPESKAELFRKSYSEILTLKLNDVSLSHRSSIEKVNNIYNGLSDEVKTLLKNEKSILDNLMKKINELTVEEANNFKNKYRDLIDMKVENVQIANKPMILQAIEECNGLESEVKKLLKEEQNHLLKLKAKLEDNTLADLQLGVVGKDIKVQGIATFYNDNGIVLMIKNDKGEICYFNQVSMNDDGSFNLNIDFTNNTSGTPNITGDYTLYMKLNSDKITEKKFTFSTEAIIALEVKEFKDKNSDVLNLNIDNVQISNKDIVETALKDYENLSKDAKNVLNNEKNLLDSLRKKIAELSVEVDANNFKATYSSLLELSVEDLNYKTHNINLTEAINTYNALSDESKGLLVDEKAHLDILAEKMVLLKIDADAVAFRENHSVILGKTTVNLTIDDKDSLDEAISKYNTLSIEAKAKLTDCKSILDTLKVRMNKLETLKELIDKVGEANKRADYVADKDKADWQQSEGDWEGNFIEGSVKIFREQIAKAQLVLDNENCTSEDVNNAIKGLKDATDKFEGSRIKKIVVTDINTNTLAEGTPIVFTLNLEDGEKIQGLDQLYVMDEATGEYTACGKGLVEGNKVTITRTGDKVGTSYVDMRITKNINGRDIVVKCCRVVLEVK